MKRIKLNELRLEEDRDLLLVRQAAREACTSMGFTIVDQTRLITALSELTRNAYMYAGKGVVFLERIEENAKSGMMITVKDHGPGISDMELAMSEGYSTSGGLGNGLPGARRLVDGFDIHSKPGEGTEVVIIKWLS